MKLCVSGWKLCSPNIYIRTKSSSFFNFKPSKFSLYLSVNGSYGTDCLFPFAFTPSARKRAKRSCSSRNSFSIPEKQKKKRERENVELVVLQLAATVGLSTHLSSEFLPSCFALPVLLQYSLLFVCTNIPSAAFHVQQNRFEIFPSRKWNQQHLYLGQ